jgi:hypothetical protein
MSTAESPETVLARLSERAADLAVREAVEQAAAGLDFVSAQAAADAKRLAALRLTTAHRGDLDFAAIDRETLREGREAAAEWLRHPDNSHFFKPSKATAAAPPTVAATLAARLKAAYGPQEARQTPLAATPAETPRDALKAAEARLKAFYNRPAH